MFQLDTECRNERCGSQRRDFIRIGALSALGLTLPEWLRKRAQAAPAKAPVRAKSCIVLWMGGGPSQPDTFDPKPDSPVAYRGPFGAIETNVPGTFIGEHLPKLAQQADKYSILRSMTHPSPSHGIAQHSMLTGNVLARGTVNPSYGSVVSKELPQDSSIPSYVSIPKAPDYAGGGLLGGGYQPLAVGNDPNNKNFSVRGLTLPKRLTVDRLDHRRKMLAAVDTLQREQELDPQFGVLDSFYQRSYDMITAPVVKKAFDINSEKPELRERYGRNTFGQSCLLARRLVESGVKFVHVDRGGWDTHRRNFESLKGKLPELDKGFSTLLEDLSERGLLESTMVVWMGEFGRTPKIDWAAQWQGGRHHFSRTFTTVVAGGGFQGGRVVGSSGPLGENVEDRPILPWDLGATMFENLGVSWDKTYNDRGRNIRVLPFGTSVVSGGLLTELL